METILGISLKVDLGGEGWQFTSQQQLTSELFIIHPSFIIFPFHTSSSSISLI